MGGCVQCVSDMQTTVRRWVGRGGGHGRRWRDLRVEATERRRWRGSLTIRGADSGSRGSEPFLKDMIEERNFDGGLQGGGMVPLHGRIVFLSSASTLFHYSRDNQERGILCQVQHTL